MVNVEVKTTAKYENKISSASASSSAYNESDAFLQASKLSYNLVVDNLNIPDSKSPSFVETEIIKVDNNSNTFSNSLSIISDIQSPKKPNTNEFIYFNVSETNDFYIDPNDNSKVICNNPGTWFIFPQFQLTCLKDSKFPANSQYDSWLSKNGVVTFDYTVTLTKKNETNLFPTIIVYTLNKGDYIQFGSRSSSLDEELYIVTKTIKDEKSPVSNAVFLDGMKLLTNNKLNSGFLNYCNFITTLSAPTNTNTNQFIPITNLDSYDFSININDNTQVICNNSGKWTFFVGIQNYGNNTGQGGIDTSIDFWFVVNGVNVENTDVVITTIEKGDYLSSTNSYTLFLNKNDILQIGIRSNSLNNILNSNIRYFLAPTGYDNYPFGISAFKLPTFSNETTKTGFTGYSNIISLVNSPKLPNNLEKIVFSDNNINDKDFSINNTKLICNNPGKWIIFAQYLIYSLNTTTNGDNSQLIGWLIVNGKKKEASSSRQSSTFLGQYNVLTIVNNQKLNKNDVIELGILSSSLDNKLNVIVKDGVSYCGINSPSVILTLIKYDE